MLVSDPSRWYIDIIIGEKMKKYLLFALALIILTACDSKIPEPEFGKQGGITEDEVINEEIDLPMPSTLTTAKPVVIQQHYDPPAELNLDPNSKAHFELPSQWVFGEDSSAVKLDNKPGRKVISFMPHPEAWSGKTAEQLAHEQYEAYHKSFLNGYCADFEPRIYPATAGGVNVWIVETHDSMPYCEMLQNFIYFEDENGGVMTFMLDDDTFSNNQEAISMAIESLEWR